MKILIVDDLPTNRKLLRAQLEAEGLEVTEAVDGVEALQVLAREKIDAIISDILMPRMDGYRFCHEVRKSVAWSKIRFILYSSTYTSPADVRLGDTVGADQFIAKPAPADTIIGALRVTAGVETHVSELPAEAAVLKQYSAVLVTKLEEKNTDLQTAMGELQRANEQISQLNAGLERRITERTAELSQANKELREALANVKQLSGLIPMCAWCKKIRDGKEYWHTVEAYLSEHTEAKLSHGACPECLAKQFEELARLLGTNKTSSS